MSETWIRSVFRRSNPVSRTRSWTFERSQDAGNNTTTLVFRIRMVQPAGDAQNCSAGNDQNDGHLLTFQLRAGVANIQIARNERIEQLACRRARIALIGTDSVKAAASIDAALTSRHSSRRGSNAKKKARKIGPDLVAPTGIESVK
jgi:hypothetical protein